MRNHFFGVSGQGAHQATYLGLPKAVLAVKHAAQLRLLHPREAVTVVERRIAVTPTTST